MSETPDKPKDAEKPAPAPSPEPGETPADTEPEKSQIEKDLTKPKKGPDLSNDKIYQLNFILRLIPFTFQ